MVTGEWGTMDRLLVLPMPGVGATDPSQNLPYASAIRLNHQVRDIQGCDFVTATQLLCSSDDPAGTLFGTTKPLLQVDLSAPVGTSDVTGQVTSLGQRRHPQQPPHGGSGGRSPSGRGVGVAPPQNTKDDPSSRFPRA